MNGPSQWATVKQLPLLSPRQGSFSSKVCQGPSIHPSIQCCHLSSLTRSKAPQPHKVPTPANGSASAPSDSIDIRSTQTRQTSCHDAHEPRSSGNMHAKAQFNHPLRSVSQNYVVKHQGQSLAVLVQTKLLALFLHYTPHSDNAILNPSPLQGSHSQTLPTPSSNLHPMTLTNKNPFLFPHNPIHRNTH